MRRRRKAKPKFYFLSALALGLAVLTFVLVFSGGGQAEITVGTIPFTNTSNITIVRDEHVYTEESHAKAVFYVTEGKRITQGTEIADIYALGYNENLSSQLAQVQQEIQDYQENTLWAGVINKELNDMNRQIKSKMSEIAQVVQGKSHADIVTLEQELTALLAGKRDYLRRNTKQDAKVEELYAKETDLEQKIETWKTKIVAEQAGIVSFNFDGVESVLTPTSLNLITRAQVEEAAKGIAPDPTAQEKPLYKIVNNYEWYALIIVEKDAQVEEFRTGTQFVMTVDGFADSSYKAEISGARILDDGSTMYVLKMVEDIGLLMNVRTGSATLKTDFTGTMVPLEALFEQEGKTGIKVVVGSMAEFVEVVVLIQDGANAIVRPVDSSIQLLPTQKVLLR